MCHRSMGLPREAQTILLSRAYRIRTGSNERIIVGVRHRSLDRRLGLYSLSVMARDIFTLIVCAANGQS